MNPRTGMSSEKVISIPITNPNVNQMSGTKTTDRYRSGPGLSDVCAYNDEDMMPAPLDTARNII